MLEWEKLQLMITNYIVMVNAYAGKQIITCSSVRNVSIQVSPKFVKFALLAAFIQLVYVQV